MMRIKKSLTAVFLAVTLGGNIASADVFYDVSYPAEADLYRLDIPTMYGNNATDTGDDANENENILLRLGMMSRDKNGKFLPDAKLSKAEFEAANRAVYSGEEVDFEHYNTVYAGQKVYQKEIITKLLSFVESMDLNGTSVDIKAHAEAAGILKGVQYNEGKEFTRREFATVLWNTLNCSYTEYDYSGDGFEISVDEDKTILNEKLGVYKINGLLNAIPGLSIYSAFAPKKGYVEINRRKCRVNGLEDAENLLGHNVEGYAKYDEEYDGYVLVYLEKSRKDETVVIDIDDIEKLDDSYIWYQEDGKNKKIKIGFLKHISYNADLTDKITPDMLDENGKVILGKSEKSGEYDVAVIKEYQNLYTKRYVSEDEKLYFNYNAEFNGEQFLEMDIDEGYVLFSVDGERKDASEITHNLSVNVLQNSSKTYTEIIASKNSITGSVTGIDEDFVIIEGEKLKVSQSYKKASDDSATGAMNIQIGSKGKFYYTADGMIVHFEPEGRTNFAMLRKVWFDGEEDKTFVKLFTQTGEWIVYETNAKTEVDGVKYEGEEIAIKINKALGENNENSPSPVRYILQNDKIKFIDTLTDNPQEEEDLERMQKCATFNGETEWVKGWDMGKGIVYHVADNVTMFIVPKDVSKEDEYEISVGSAIPADTRGVSFTAYNPDKYYCARLAVLNGVTAPTTNTTFVYIKNVTSRYDEEADEILEGIDCYLLTRKKEELDEMFYKLPKDWKERFGVDNLEATFVGVTVDDGEITGIGVNRPHVANNKIGNDRRKLLLA